MPSNVNDWATADQKKRIATFKQDSLQSALYNPQGRIGSEWSYHSGLVVMPLAKPVSEVVGSPPVKVLRVHAPYWERQVGWKFGKSRNPPALPAPVGDDNFVLVGADMILPFPKPTIEGLEYDWEASGIYTFICADAFRFFTEGFETSGTPFPMPSQYHVIQSRMEGYNADPDKIDMFGNYFWHFHDPLIMPGTVFSHKMILGEDKTVTDLRI